MPESEELTPVEKNLPARLSRVFRSKKLVIAGAATTISVALKGFDIGTRILDWAQRYEFVRSHNNWMVKASFWLLTPTGQSSLVVVAVIALILVIMWVVNAPPRHAPTASLKVEAVTASESPAESTHPNLVSVDAQFVLVGQDSDDTLYQCEFEKELVIGRAAVAFIKNQVDDKPISRVESVRAHITFSEITGPRKTEINNALWLGSRDTLRTFEVGDTERLILAVKPFPHGAVYALESNYVTRAGEKVYSPLCPELLGKIYIVTVRLVGGEHGEINQTFKYRLETKPDLYIEKIDESETVSEAGQLRMQIGTLSKELTDWKEQYDEEHSAALRLKTLNEQYEMQIKKLTCDAEEAGKKRLAAASNLHGIETDRNNYRTWYNELAWLNATIKPQKEDISNYVKVIAARPCLLNLKERVAVVDLVIRNDSFFDIAIKPDAVGGRFATKKGLLYDPAKALIDLNHPAVEKLKPTKETTMAVIQPLLRSEAEEIEDAISEANDGRFWLGNLNIPISIQNAEPLQVDSKPLRINSEVEHVYFREFGGLTFEGEVTTPQELLRDIDALPFPERLRIYQEMSKAYGEILVRLHEGEQDKDPEELANEAIRRNTNNA